MLTPEQRDHLMGMIAERATRMTFSEDPKYSEAVVESVIKYDVECVEAADDFTEAEESLT